jgi:hypothetical protein
MQQDGFFAILGVSLRIPIVPPERNGKTGKCSVTQLTRHFSLNHSIMTDWNFGFQSPLLMIPTNSFSEPIALVITDFL